MAQRGGPVNPQFVSLDEYDCLVYPGFLRRTVRGPAHHAATRLSSWPSALRLLLTAWRICRTTACCAACSTCGARASARRQNPLRVP